MIGQRIHNYEIVAYLGEGGMGTVYQAFDSALGRPVAIKMLNASLLTQPQFLERFKKEAHVLAQLLHPNIAVIYNFIEQGGYHYMIMEYVEGKNLDMLLRLHKMLSYQIVVPVFGQALDGLHHAHKKGIFHRDIKPANLILTPEGTVKLMDFGIAMVTGEQRLTRVNGVVGTLEFMAPELLQGAQPSAASDIYAAGVTMYELTCGKLPFESNTDYNLMQDIINKKPISLEKLNPTVPADLEHIIMKCLEKNPENRYPGAKAFQQALYSAFPELKDTDLSTVYPSLALPAAPMTQTVTLPNFQPRPAPLMETRSEAPTALATPLLSRLKTGWFKGNRIAFAAGSTVLLLIATIILINALTSKPGSGANPATSGLSLAKDPPDQPRHSTPLETHTVMSREPQTNPQSETVILPMDTAVSKENINSQKIEKPLKERPTRKKPATKDKVDKPMQKDGSSRDPAQPDKGTPETLTNNHPVTKSIKLNTRIEVDLYLPEPLDAASLQTGQVLNFRVTNPVYYDNEIIIERGAAATGRIKSIGSKKLRILFTSVRGANGEMLPFQQDDLSGRIHEMVSSRNYVARLKRGTIINF